MTRPNQTIRLISILTILRVKELMIPLLLDFQGKPCTEGQNFSVHVKTLIASANKQMKPRHRAIWSGLFRFGRNLAEEGLAILRPSIRTALQDQRSNVQRMRNAVQTHYKPWPSVGALFFLEDGMFGSLLKAALSPVDLTLGVAADVVTIGGALTDQDKPYTAQAAERLMDNVEDVFEPEEPR